MLWVVLFEIYGYSWMRHCPKIQIFWPKPIKIEYGLTSWNSFLLIYWHNTHNDDWNTMKNKIPIRAIHKHQTHFLYQELLAFEVIIYFDLELSRQNKTSIQWYSNLSQRSGNTFWTKMIFEKIWQVHNEPRVVKFISAVWK